MWMTILNMVVPGSGMYFDPVTVSWNGTAWLDLSASYVYLQWKNKDGKKIAEAWSAVNTSCYLQNCKLHANGTLMLSFVTENDTGIYMVEFLPFSDAPNLIVEWYTLYLQKNTSETVSKPPWVPKYRSHGKSFPVNIHVDYAWLLFCGLLLLVVLLARKSYLLMLQHQSTPRRWTVTYVPHLYSQT